MERLRQKDLDALFSYLPELYAHRDLEEFRSSVVKSFSGVIPSELDSYNEVDLQNKTGIFIPEPVPPNFPDLKKAFDSHTREHPVISHYHQTGNGRAMQISDFLTSCTYIET